MVEIKKFFKSSSLAVKVISKILSYVKRFQEDHKCLSLQNSRLSSQYTVVFSYIQTLHLYLDSNEMLSYQCFHRELTTIHQMAGIKTASKSV